MSEKKTAVYIDAEGREVPAKYVNDYDKMRDRITRKVYAAWKAEEERMRKLKQWTAEQLSLADIEQQKLAKIEKPSERKSFRLRSFDGEIIVQREVQVRLEFDSRIGLAQQLIGEAIDEMTVGTINKNIAKIARAAFSPRKGNKLDRARVHELCKLEVDHPKWLQAVEIIKSCEQAVGSRVYFRVGKRTKNDQAIDTILLDMAVL